MKLTFTGIIIIVALLYMSSCNQTGSSSTDSRPENNESTRPQGQAYVEDETSEKTILQIAVGSEDHSILEAGVQAAGLENVLANPGPLTVFAPTDAAFDKLPEGTLDNLLRPENKSKLANIITYHAAPGTYTMNDFDEDLQLYMATGDHVQIEREGDKVTVNGAEIVASVKASNGIVHVVDEVLLPPEDN